MRFLINLKYWCIISCTFVLITSLTYVNKNESSPYTRLRQASLKSNSPVSLRTYYLIEKYSDEYRIPKHIAYNIAFLETSYQGPFDWTYNPFLTSSEGAVGPMQVMVNTAKYVNKTDVTKTRLKNDLELNISTSMKYLNQLHKRYKNWGLTCGYYNTGCPKINKYASFCIKNKDYTKNWESY
jgi:soluble lytic murein transglycosylase-like protein